MQPYVVLNSHHIGKSHIQNGTECEDYSASYSDAVASIVVVSDGHGDKNCFRSKRGAKIACEVCVDLLNVFRNKAEDIADVQSEQFDYLIKSLESTIVDRWTEEVLADVKKEPFSENELIVTSPDAREMYESGHRLEKAYGCTLVAAIVTSRYWIGIQIGDGKCVAAYEDGVFVEPVPCDEENNYGNHSGSLCNSNAKQIFRHYSSPILPLAVFTASDGVEESFDNQGLMNCFFSVAYWTSSEGYDEALKKLNELLPQISEGGSGDDVSLAALVNCDASLASPRQTMDQVNERVNGSRNQLDRYNRLLAEANVALDAQLIIQAELEAEVEKAKEQLALLEEKFKKQSENCEEKASELETIKEKQKMAQEQMEKALKYQESAEQFWRAKREKLGLPPVSNNREMLQVEVQPDKSASTKQKDTNDNEEVEDKRPDREMADTAEIEPHPAEEHTIAESDKESTTEGEVTPDDDETQIKPFTPPDLDDTQPHQKEPKQPDSPDFSSLSFEELTRVYNKGQKAGDDRRENGFGRRMWPFVKKEK